MKLDKKNWQTVRFGDVVYQGKGAVDPETSGLERYIAGEHMNSEDLHLRQWGTVGEGYLGPAFHRLFEKGDILYGSRRTYLKKVAVADFDGITSNTTFIIRENHDAIEPGLVAFLMLSDRFTEHSVKNSKGSVNPYINFKDITEFKFRLPPRDIQAQLVEVLWAADELKEKYRVMLNTLEGIYTKLLADVFQNLDKRYSCVKSTIGNEVALVNGSAFSAVDWKEEGIPIVRIQNLNGNSEYNHYQGDIKGKVIIEPGNLLFAWSGNRGTSFGPTIWKGKKGLLNQHIFRLDFNEAKLSKYFMYEYLKYLTAEIEQHAHGAVGLVHITKGVLQKFSLNIPEFVIQEKISDKIMLVDNQRTAARETFNNATALTNQLINQIFSV